MNDKSKRLRETVNCEQKLTFTEVLCVEHKSEYNFMEELSLGARLSKKLKTPIYPTYKSYRMLLTRFMSQ